MVEVCFCINAEERTLELHFVLLMIKLPVPSRTRQGSVFLNLAPFVIAYVDVFV